MDKKNYHQNIQSVQEFLNNKRFPNLHHGENVKLQTVLAEEFFPQKNYNLSYLIRYLLPSSYLIRATERQSLINCLAHDSRRATIHQRSAVKESVTAGYFLIGGPTCYIIRNLLHNRFTIEGRHMNNILAVPSCCAVLNFTIKAPLSIYGQLLNWSRSNGTAAVVH